LCRALAGNGVFDADGGIDFTSIPAAAGIRVSLVHWYPTSLTRVNAELAAGHPVIAQVTLPGGVNHFVVITGRTGGTYYINDPWWGDRNTINARYGNPATAIHSIIAFHGEHQAKKT
jgi:hypothetical protein